VLKAVKIRLGAPNYPGDTMSMTGQVTKKEDGLVEVAVRGANSLGDHVSGTVTLELHDPPIAWGDAAHGASSKKAKKQKKSKKSKKDKR
jgi:hypothetical protein